MLKLLSGSCARARFASAPAADFAASIGATRPFEEIPSSKMSLTKTALVVFDLIRGKPPDLASLIKSNQQAYGNIFNVSFGPISTTVVLRPEDVEAMFRTDGKVPTRDAMPIWVDAMKSLGRDLTLFHRSYTMTVRNFMRRHNLFYISPQTTFGELQDILTEEPHSSYPLIDNPENKVLLGSIRRENLTDLLRQHLRPVRGHKRRILANYTGDEDDVVEIDFSRETSPHLGNRRPSLPMRYRRVRHSLINSFLSMDEEPPFSDIEMLSDAEGSLTFPQELTNLENKLLAKTIPTQDVQVDPAPFQLVEETSLYKAHSLFALLGLSHSFVTKNGKLVGVVTLEDLVNAVRLGEAIKQHPRYVDPPQQEMRQLGTAGRHGSDPSPDELHSDVDTLTEESDQLQN